MMRGFVDATQYKSKYAKIQSSVALAVQIAYPRFKQRKQIKRYDKKGLLKQKSGMFWL